MACLMKLKDQGKIRAIGVSNVTLEELKENVETGEVSTNQFRYSMLFRNPEKDALPYCRENDIATLTYMSLEQGLLTGKVTDKYDCTLAQLVIAWTAAQPGVTHVLCGARRLSQIVDNAAAGDLEIAPPDLQRIRSEVEALGEPA